jgi:non-ribosomal peptide synthetase component F
MTTLGVHRIIERQSAAGGDRIALQGDDLTLTYRELNHRANAAARELMSCGVRRGSQVIVRMERSPELAVALLAVLKAGAAYTWLDASRADSRCPYGMSLLEDGIARSLPVDTASLATPSQAPNLPIVTRAADVACVLPQPNGLPGVLLPHATIAALYARPVPQRSSWCGEAGALDLWLPLMAGATVSLDAAPAQVAAA